MLLGKVVSTVLGQVVDGQEVDGQVVDTKWSTVNWSTRSSGRLGQLVDSQMVDYAKRQSNQSFRSKLAKKYFYFIFKAN